MVDTEKLEALSTKGIEAAEKGYIHSAQVFLGQVPEQQRSPELTSYLAYCQAKSESPDGPAAKTCEESIAQEPDNPTHYLILGRIMLLRGDKASAIEAFRQGLARKKDSRIANELNKLGLRRPPVIKQLSRSHPLNRYLGKLLYKLGLR